MPKDRATIRKGVTTTFWLTLHAPREVRAGTYRGLVTLSFANGESATLALNARLFATPLDELDVPAGPWGCSISTPWYSEDMARLRQGDVPQLPGEDARVRLHDVPRHPDAQDSELAGRLAWIDFSRADWEMAEARAAGFTGVVVNYNGGIGGFNNYNIDEAAMSAAGFTDYVSFLRAVLGAVDAHARQANWLPVAYNLCDEPIGDAIAASAANAEAWREAAPEDLLTTGATSIESPQPDDPHMPLVQALKIPDLNGHDEAALAVIKQAGNDWAFYNGGNRWTFGTYMYKCAQAVRHEVPPLVALERQRRRPLLRAGLPRGRLRVVRHECQHGPDPRHQLRAGDQGGD